MQNDNNKKIALLILVNLVNSMISLLSLSEIVNEKSKFQWFFLFSFSPPTNFVIFLTKKIGFSCANLNNFANILEIFLVKFPISKNKKHDGDILNF
jgi:hypothetical protein